MDGKNQEQIYQVADAMLEALEELRFYLENNNRPSRQRMLEFLTETILWVTSEDEEN